MRFIWGRSYSELLLWRRHGRSGGRSGGLECKGEERGHAEKGERHEIVPREFLLQKRDRDADEDDERDDLLNELELESRKLAIAEAIRRLWVAKTLS